MLEKERRGVIIGYFKRLRSHTNDITWEKFRLDLCASLIHEMLAKNYKLRTIKRGVEKVVEGDEVDYLMRRLTAK